MPSPRRFRSGRAPRLALATVTTVTIVGATVAACAVPPFKRVEKRAAQELAFVEETVALSLAEVKGRLHRFATEGRMPLAPPFHQFRLEPQGGTVFPDEASLRDQAADNPALARYVALDSALRASDFYLFDVSDTFWASEYVYRGEPARFKTSFILHLSASGPGGADTTLEAIEYLPVVWLGDRFGLGHAGPAFLNDVRRVAPTTQDRVALLKQLTRVLREDPR